MRLWFEPHQENDDARSTSCLIDINLENDRDPRPSEPLVEVPSCKYKIRLLCNSDRATAVDGKTIRIENARLKLTADFINRIRAVNSRVEELD